MFKLRKPLVNVDIMGEPLSLGDWKREKELGSGGFGVVYLWTNKRTGDCLAVKKCRWNLESDLTRKQQQRWAQEVEIMKTIRNENIVAFREMPEDLKKVLVDYNSMNLPVLSMEYCSLGNLRDVLVQNKNCCGLREIDVLFILKDISNALVYLHKINVTHRDVKPENILLQYCDNRRKPVIYKLIDLGYAKELNNETASFVGTVQYLAPEIFTQQKYTKKVDYWSFGIVTFEIICGLRPFLHTFTPWQSISYLEKKPSNVIAILLTHTGDIKSYSSLLNEKHINGYLAELLEKWLQTVLEYLPEKRGGDDNISAFTSLQTILAKKIITVFSVYNYQFYSYEINESTLFTTLQGWIARDTNISIDEQYVITTYKSNSVYACDYYDENNSDAMVFVLKKDSAFTNNLSTNLPTLIKILFEDIETEFKFGTLNRLFAQTLYLTLNESKSVESLKSAIYFQKHSVENDLNKFSVLYARLSEVLKTYLSEIEFYNYLEASLFVKVYEDTNYTHIKDYLQDYKCYMQKLAEIVDVFNSAMVRYKTLVSKYVLVKNSYDEVFDLVERCDSSMPIEEVCQSINQINESSTGSQPLKFVSKTIKLKDNLIKSSLCDYIREACNCGCEINSLIDILNAFKSNFEKVKSELRKIQFNKIKGLKHRPKDKEDTMKISDGVDDVLRFNTAIRYRLQELMDVGILQHKTFVDEINSQIVLE